MRTSHSLLRSAGRLTTALVLLACPALAFQTAPPETEIQVPCVEGTEPFILAYRQWADTTIGTVTDTDIFRFFGRAGDVVRLSSHSTAWLDPEIRYLDPVGVQFDSASCIGGSGGCGIDHVTTLPSTGVFTLVLRDLGLDEIGGVTLSLERVIPDIPVPAIDYGTTAYINIDFVGDQDFVTIQGDANTLVDIAVHSTAWLDTRLEVLAPDGSVLTTGACDGGSGGCGFSLNLLTLPQTGTYYLHFWDAGFDEVGTITLDVTCLLANCPPPRPDVALGTSYCTANSNSSGLPAKISASGSPNVSDNYLNLLVADAPPGKVGLFFFGQNQTSMPFPGGQGNLCVGPSGLKRLPGVGTCANGTVRYSPNLTNMVQGIPFLPGATWNFQLWFRDKNPAATTNTSDAIAITLQ